MPGTLDKQIQVRIKALVEGTRDAKELQTVLSSIQKQGGKKFDLDTRGASASGIKFVTVLRQLSPAADNVVNKVEGLSSALGPGAGLLGRAVPIVGVLAAIAGVGLLAGGAVFKLAQHAAEAGAKFHDLALETGLSVETLSGLELQLTQSGATLEDFSNGVFFLQKNLGAAAEGNKALKKTFADLGVTDANAALKDTEGTLRTVLKGLAALTDEGVRNAKGSEVLGRAYKQLRVFIADTNGDIDAAIKKARELGLVMSDDAADAADEFGDALDELRARAEGAGRVVGNEVIPQLSAALKDLSESLGDNRDPLTAFGEGLSEIILFGRLAASTLRDVIAAANSATDIPLFLNLNAQRLRNEQAINSGQRFDLTQPLTPEQIARGERERERALKRAGVFGDSDNITDRGGGKSKRESQLPQLLVELEKKVAEFNRVVEAGRIAARQAAADGALRLLKDQLEREQSLLDEQLATGFASIEDFYQRRGELQQDAIDAELKREREKQSALSQEFARIERQNGDELAFKKKEIDLDTKRPAAEREEQKRIAAQEASIKLEQELQRISAEIGQSTERVTVLERERAGLWERIARDQRAARAELEKQISDALDEINSLNGRTSQVAIRAINDRFSPLLDKIATEQGTDSPLYQAITELVGILSDRARIQELVERADLQGKILDVRSAEVRAQTRDNVLAEAAAQKELNDLAREYAERQLVILQNALTIAEANKEAKTVLDLRGRIAEVEALRNSAVTFGQQLEDTAINTAFDGLSNVLNTAVTDFRNLKSAGLDAVRSLLSALTQLILKAALLKILGAVLGGIGFGGASEGAGGSGAGSFLAGKFATGGVATRRGVYELAEEGPEGIINARALRNIGRGTIDFINRTGRLPSFAASGAPANFAPAAAAAPTQVTVPIRNVNVFDVDEIAEQLGAAGGLEKVVFNIISRNPQKFSRALKS